jgi:hypothetical protein
MELHLYLTFEDNKSNLSDTLPIDSLIFSCLGDFASPDHAVGTRVDVVVT